jgi:hypothetical protein
MSKVAAEMIIRLVEEGIKQEYEDQKKEAEAVKLQELEKMRD